MNTYSKHTITEVIRAAGVVGKREHGGYHRFFNTACWNVGDVGLALTGLMVALLPENDTVMLTIDDTLARHTGKHIADWPGHKKDDVLLTTDLLMTAEQMIECYCARWSLEETFEWVKGKLGFEDAQNRTQKAVERTAPIALWAYSLVVYWYAKWSAGRRHLLFPIDPWNRNKNNPTFADMLATLRREAWTVWISDQAVGNRFDQKHLEPLLDLAANG